MCTAPTLNKLLVLAGNKPIALAHNTFAALALVRNNLTE